MRLCRPAPQQEKNDPITITQGDGHARTPITGVLFIDSPNLKHPKKEIQTILGILMLEFLKKKAYLSVANRSI